MTLSTQVRPPRIWLFDSRSARLALAMYWTHLPLSKGARVIISPIRGDEDLPSETLTELGASVGPVGLVLLGDYSSPPDTEHPAVVLAKRSVPDRIAWVAFIDTPLEVGIPPVVVTLDRRSGDTGRFPTSLQASALLDQRWSESSETGCLDLTLSDPTRRCLLDYVRQAERESWVRRICKAPASKIVFGRLRDHRDIGVPTSIEAVDIRSGSGLPHEVFQHCHRLRIVILVGCDLVEVPNLSQSAENLEIIIIDKNRIRSLPGWLQAAHHLTIISVFRNQLHSLPEWIAELPELASMSIGANAITTLPPWLAEMPALRSLSATGLRLNSTEGLDLLASSLTACRLSKTTVAGSLVRIVAPSINAPFPTLPGLCSSELP